MSLNLDKLELTSLNSISCIIYRYSQMYRLTSEFEFLCHWSQLPYLYVTLLATYVQLCHPKLPNCPNNLPQWLMIPRKSAKGSPGTRGLQSVGPKTSPGRIIWLTGSKRIPLIGRNSFQTPTRMQKQRDASSVWQAGPNPSTTPSLLSPFFPLMLIVICMKTIGQTWTSISKLLRISLQCKSFLLHIFNLLT